MRDIAACSEMAGRTVKIAIVGDEGVGKSSLVLAAVHNIFNEDPVPTLPPTRLPPDSVESYMSPAPATLILDTCSRPEEKQAWELNVQEANAIILTFAANDFETLRRVAMHWMPELARVGVKNTPIILTACKSDVGDIRAGNFHDVRDLSAALSAGTKNSTHCFALSAIMHFGPAAYPSYSHGVQAHRDIPGNFCKEATVRARYLLLCRQICCTPS